VDPHHVRQSRRELQQYLQLRLDDVGRAEEKHQRIAG